MGCSYVETGNNNKKHNLGSYLPASDNVRRECVSDFRLHKPAECSSLQPQQSGCMKKKPRPAHSFPFSR